MTNLDSILKSILNLDSILKRHYFANKGLSGQGYGFSSGHVWMWELDCEERWTLKNWCFWTSLIRGMQIKTTKKYHLRLVRMDTAKKSTNNKCWRVWGEKGTFLQCWWECKLEQPLWRTVWRFLKKKTGNRTTIRPSNPTAGPYTLRKS